MGERTSGRSPPSTRRSTPAGATPPSSATTRSPGCCAAALGHLRPLHEAAVRLRGARDDLAAAREPEWRSEAAALAARAAALQDALAERLAAWDPCDPCDAVLFLEAVSGDVLRLARHHRAAARSGEVARTH